VTETEHDILIRYGYKWNDNAKVGYIICM